jgi:ketosteroid isomerase-like protein
MKKTCTTGLLLATLLLFIGTKSMAQSANAPQTKYKDMIGENPAADADIKLVGNYLNTIIDDVDKATAMLAAEYKGYGPGPDDSSTVIQVNESWKKGNSTQTNRKTEFLPETFNVKSGDLEGHWVSTWGTYSFTENGKDVKVPFQFTARVKNGKINRSVVYYDQLAIMKTLGFTVTPPTK